MEHHVEFDNTSILSNGHESSNLFVVAGLDPVLGSMICVCCLI